MPFEGSSPSSATQDASANLRLDSWKEIASYLGKGERTAKRWEAERALPVHRLPGGGRGSVYSYSAELDEWLKSTRSLAEPDVEMDLEAADEEADGTVLATAARDPALPVVGNEIPGAGGPDLPIAVPPNAWRIAAAASLQGDRRDFKLGWKPVLVGALAAGLVGAAVFAAVNHSPLDGIPHRISSIAGIAQAATVHPDSAIGYGAVSDVERVRAHELYLKGRYEWNQRTPDSLNQALDSFTQAIVHNPNSAEAYAGMADTYNFQRIFSTLPPGDMYPRAIAAARRAVELDDSLAEGHRALAFAEVWGARNCPDGYREFRRSIELNPKDPLAHNWFGNALALANPAAPWEASNVKGFQEALVEISRAQELDPGSHTILADKGIVLYSAGKKEEGTALLQQVERADPGLATVHTYLAFVEFERNNYPAYLAESEKSAQLHDDRALKELTEAVRAGYAHGGERGLSKALFAKAESCDPITGHTRVGRAHACVGLGKNQEALQLLEEASANHDANLAEWFSTGALPEWKAIKDEPRFQALLKKVTFPQASGQASTSPASAAALAPLQPTDYSR